MRAIRLFLTTISFKQLPTCLGVVIFLCFSGQGFAQTTVYFPQIANGGGYITTFYFAGLGKASSNVTVDLFAQNGTGLIVQTNRGSGGTFSFSLPANGALTLRTTGAGTDISVGWARVTSDIPIGATEVFQAYSGNLLLGQAGVLTAEPTGSATLIVSVDGRGQNTGIALANVGLSSNPVSLTLYNQSGTIVGTSNTTLPPRNQIAKFIDEFPGFERISLPFEGTLSVSGLSRFSLVGLLLNGPQLSTIATLPGRIPLPTSTTFQVSAITYLYLAGMPTGTVTDGNTAPLNSPVEAGLTLIPGRELQFSSAGSIIAAFRGTGGPEGGRSSDCSDDNGISGITAPAGGVVGVFLGPTQPSQPAPASVDFSGGVAQLSRFQPALKQQFYIGSGVANNQAKKFVIPEGATRLFLAPLFCGDRVSSYSGSYSVTAQYVP